MNLIIDLGQSGARLKIENEVISVPIAKSTSSSTVETLDSIFRTVPEGNYENVFLSLTGVNGDVKSQAPIADLCKNYFKSKNVAVMDDGFAAFIGALGERSGVVLTLGSGIVAISGNHGKFAHTDGKGSIFGDFGGGFWLGQAAMRRAIATLDGRDESPQLVSLLKEELTQLEALDNKVGPEASLLCINAAKTVIQGAERGVSDALHILEKGAEHLAITVKSAWIKAKNSDGEIPFLVLTGGLTRSDLYVKLIQKEISKLVNCNFIEAEADHLVGAEVAAEMFPDGVEHLMKWVRFI